MKKNSYEFTSIFQYAEDGINITFPDIPSAISYAQSTEEAIKNAEEVLGLILYDMESDKKEIPKATPFENIKTKEDEKAIIIRVWMPLVRNELDEQAVKKTLSIPEWMNTAALKKGINFSQVLQEALLERLDS